MRNLCLLLCVMLVTHAYSQQTIIYGNPTTSSTLGTNQPQTGQVLTTDGVMNYWGDASEGGTDVETLISEDIDVIGVTVGNYADGMTISSNTTLRTFLMTMLQQRIAPSYTNPTLTLAASGSLAVEAGTLLTPILTPTWTQRDAGVITNYELRENTVVIYSDSTATTHTRPEFTIGDTSYAYYGRAYYEEGITKNDNFGDPDPTGKILAGTINSATRTYIGRRRYWYDADTSTNTTPDSAEIRTLSSTALNAANGTTFSISIPVGTSRVIIAYPATLREVSTIKYVELGNAEVKDTFVESTVSVEGANGFSPINYRVYIYTPAVSFGDAATYNVTI